MSDLSLKSLRAAERFLLAPPLPALFNADRVALCDISAKGVRFRHDGLLLTGGKSVLRIEVAGHPPVILGALIVWTQQNSSTGSAFVSGAKIYGDSDVIDALLTFLRDASLTQRVEERRSADRYLLAEPIRASWNQSLITIEDLSTRGARVATGAMLRPGDSASLRFSVPESAIEIEVTALVVWAAVRSIGSAGDHLHRAGLAISEKADFLRLAIGQLCEGGRALIDAQSLALKLKIIRARARVLAPAHTAIEASGVPAEQYLLVQCVREELRLNPEEAMYWYRQARLSINDPKTRLLAPPIADHPDALAVWEYLDRTVDPSIISRSFALPKG